VTRVPATPVKVAAPKPVAKNQVVRAVAEGEGGAAEADQPMLLVLAQANYPGWRATVDKNPVPLWKANYAFQALEVPAGRHEVQVYFQSRSFEIGAVISTASMLICGFLFRRFGAKTGLSLTRA
jgi:uncharacterized membrane protein YfhO